MLSSVSTMDEDKERVASRVLITPGKSLIVIGCNQSCSSWSVLGRQE